VANLRFVLTSLPHLNTTFPDEKRRNKGRAVRSLPSGPNWPSKKASVSGSSSSPPQRVQPLPLPLIGHDSGPDEDANVVVNVAVVRVEGGLVIPEVGIELFLKGIEVLVENEDAREKRLSDLLFDELLALANSPDGVESCQRETEADSSPGVGFGVFVGLTDFSEAHVEDLPGPLDDTEVTLLDFSGSSGVDFADLLGDLESPGVDFGNAVDEALSEEVGFAVLLEATFDGLGGVGVGFFGFGVGLSVSGAFEVLSLEDGLGFLLGLGALLFGFFVLLFGGLASAPSPGFALFSPNGKHVETRFHSCSYSEGYLKPMCNIAENLRKVPSPKTDLPHCLLLPLEQSTERRHEYLHQHQSSSCCRTPQLGRT